MKNSQVYLSCVLSGLLLGLSVPNFPLLPLGFLGWFWLVPLLFEIKKTEKFSAFVVRVLIAVGIGFSIITLWVVHASILGLLASIFFGVFVWTVPFLYFFVVRRFLSLNAALLSLSFFWTGWEWLYHQTDFSFGAVRLGYTQADMLWLIQFADLVGIDGVTFWLVLVGIVLFCVTESLFLKNQRATLGINGLLTWEFAFLIALFVLPLGYSAWIYSGPQPSAAEISISAVQPNVSPLLPYTPQHMLEIFGRQIVLTNLAVKEEPDLILWNEVAVPYILSENAAANGRLAREIQRWNTPVLTGVIEVKNYAEGEKRPLLLEAQNRDQEFFNAAAMFQPSDIQAEHLAINLADMYLKRRLMPFLERVPFSDRIPSLSFLIIPIGLRPRLSPGENAKTLKFEAKNGETVTIGTMICYENLYPEMSADMVRNGAQVLMALTNEGFFAGSQGQYQLAAFSRFRSIETRRAVVRSAATGMTWATDRYGRVTAQVPMWSEQTLQTKVTLSDEQTFFVKWGYFFPKVCALLSVLLVLRIIWRVFHKRLTGSL